MEKFLAVSSLLSLALGIALRSYERKRQGELEPDPKRLSALQVAYSILLAYPFCAAYVWVDQFYFR